MDQEGRGTSAWDMVDLGWMGLQAPHVSYLPPGCWEGLSCLLINAACLEAGCFSSEPNLIRDTGHVPSLLKSLVSPSAKGGLG